MPRQAKSPIPTYRRHRASGQAVVTLNGVDHYLGPWNSPASKAEYDRITSEWLVRGRRLVPGDDAEPMLMKELINGYRGHIEATMPDVEADKVRLALKPVKDMHGETLWPSSARWPMPRSGRRWWTPSSASRRSGRTWGSSSG